MSQVTLRAVTEPDLPILGTTHASWGDAFDFFGFASVNWLERWFGESGCLGHDGGLLAVLADDELVGYVSFGAVEYGPGTTSRGMRIGIALLPEARGQGYGSSAQQLVAEYLFATTLVNRVEAATDANNQAERRALEKAGFINEGVMRGSQYRDGSWHDLVIYSRLRSDT